MEREKSRYLPMLRLVTGADTEYLKTNPVPAKRWFMARRRKLMYGNLRCLRKEVIRLRKKVKDKISAMQMPSEDLFALYCIKYWAIRYLAAEVGVQTFFRLNPTSEIACLIEAFEAYKALALKEPEVGI